MRFRNFLKMQLGESIPNDIVLPSGYHVVGHVILLQLDDSAKSIAKKIGQYTLDFEKRGKSVAVRTGPTKGIMRVPNYRVIAGSCNTITTLVEAGVKFQLDPLRITFSGGNKSERIKLAREIDAKERVLDMFACVGQFSIHIAKESRAKVTAIEINQEAFQFLKTNIRINQVTNLVDAINGDCREITPKNQFDRVIMGYLHNTISYLPIGITALLEKGKIHMHQSIHASELQNTCNTIHTICNQHNYDSEIEIREIKQYAPNITHYAFDITVERTDRQ